MPEHTRERIKVLIADEYTELAVHVARRIADIVRHRNSQGQAAVLGLATGSTPIAVYRELIRMHREEGLSFANTITFNLDEYWPMRHDSIHSYHRYMWENFFQQVDIRESNVHLLNGELARDDIPAATAQYEGAIRAAGGINFQILGIGKTGHIGFNEPGSGAASRTRLIHLDTITRRDAAADFFGEENVPREAITMGIATILEADEIAIIATGEHKAAIVKRAIEGEPDLDVAATFLQTHPNTTFYLDGAAAAKLTRVAQPWLVDEVEWTDKLTIQAVAWLSLETGKAILKLTQQDYAEHKLSSLVALHASPGAVNGRVFNSLGARIRGKSKLPRRERVVVFSPHPDDDVISMGGILRKLVENENEIIVAYMTSGNIAVFDHDVRRYVDFIERLALHDPQLRVSSGKLSAKVYDALSRKQPGDVDIAEVQDLKRMIREGEAVSGLEVIGLSRDAARFLNLPFYRTGTVRKDPVTEDDVRIVQTLLEEFQPRIIFIAGDLTDPHGTHRLCKDAIDAALARMKSAGRRMPESWLYRGAWQEWPVTDATWLVPLSQEELRRKIQAIFKHQSQKDSAPFPGEDDREFWQRVEERNKGTAAMLDRLGLAEYYAMEAYVVEGV